MGPNAGTSQALDAFSRLKAVESNGVDVELEMCCELHDPAAEFREVHGVAATRPNANCALDRKLEPPFEGIRIFRVHGDVFIAKDLDDGDSDGVAGEGEVDVDEAGGVPVAGYVLRDPARQAMGTIVDIAALHPRPEANLLASRERIVDFLAAPDEGRESVGGYTNDVAKRTLWVALEVIPILYGDGLDGGIRRGHVVIPKDTGLVIRVADDQPEGFA
jgi:hypothetical protein